MLKTCTMFQNIRKVYPQLSKSIEMGTSEVSLFVFKIASIHICVSFCIWKETHSATQRQIREGLCKRLTWERSSSATTRAGPEQCGCACLCSMFCSVFGSEHVRASCLGLNVFGFRGSDVLFGVRPFVFVFCSVFC